MVLERELLKLERLYAREITRVFDRAVASLDPSKRINLTRAIARPAIKAKIQTATRNIFEHGVVSAEDEIKQALKRASAATIDTPLNDFESGIVKKYAEDTTEYMGFLSKDMQKEMNASLAEGHALGESIPKLSGRLQDTWKLNKVRAVRYARTQTNDVCNAAHVSRYYSSSVVEYVQFSAHLDHRTSPVCRMYHKTIWKKDDPAVQVPPLHFSCRSRLLPAFGKFPGERDYKKLADGTELTGKQVKAIDRQLNTFKTKYWQSSGDKALAKMIKQGTRGDIYTNILKEEDKIRYDKYETGVAFDSKTGKELLRKSGNHNSVAFDEADIPILSNNIFTHNHPGGTSFSAEDIHIACKAGMKEIRVTSANKSYRMYIEDGSSFSSAMYKNELKRSIETDNRGIRSYYEMLIGEGKMTSSEASADHWNAVWKSTINRHNVAGWDKKIIYTVDEL